MKVSRYLIIVIWFAAGLVGVRASSLWEGLDTGPHGVGFRLVDLVDSSRTYGTEGEGRRVRMYVWYPAESDDSRRSERFAMYADLALDDFGPIRRPKTASLPERYAELPFARSLPEDELERVLDSRVAAVRDAAIAAGSFPLVVLGQGLYYESPVTHAVLCEYLASHGYVVVTCPLVGTESRWVRLTVVDLETQVRDMEFILCHALALDRVDPARVGLIGFDLGGMAGLVIAIRRSDVDAFLSLDCGILSEHPSQLPGSMPGYDIRRFRIPWMHMLSRRHYELTRGDGSVPSLFEKKENSDNYLLIFDGAQHAEFTSYAMMENRRPVPTYWGPSEGDARKRYAAICRYGRLFLDAYVKKDSFSPINLEEELDATDPDVPMEVLTRSGGDADFLSVDEWLNSIFEDGIQHAVSTARAIAEGGSSSEILDEAVLNQLGYKFLYNWADVGIAIALFELNVAFHPESSNVYDSLGEAYLANGGRERAIANYRRSLEINPENDNARRVLESLGSR